MRNPRDQAAGELGDDTLWPEDETGDTADLGASQGDGARTGMTAGATQHRRPSGFARWLWVLLAIVFTALLIGLGMWCHKAQRTTAYEQLRQGRVPSSAWNGKPAATA